MFHASHVTAALALAAVTVTSWSGSARADDPPRPYVAPSERTIAYVEKTPNENLIAGGAFLLGTSYLFSVIAAAKSDVPSDDRLYIPVAGPWLNLNERPDCGSGPGQPECRNEPINKGLLVANGVVQGIGALEIVGGFLFPKSEVVTVRAGSVSFHPMAGRSGVGISATGSF